MSDKESYLASNGQYITNLLFVEKWTEMGEEFRTRPPVFSLNVDKPGLINARTTFVELMDPTGVEWADKYLGSYRHWLKLCEKEWFAAALDGWLAEIKMRQTAISIKKIQEIAAGDSAQSINANKYLAEEGWKKSGRGRPSKAEMDAELKKNVKAIEDTADDLARIGGLKVIKGGKHSL